MQTYERTPEHDIWFAEAERVMQFPGRVLTDEQRRYYFEHGYLLVENCVGPEWLARLWAVTNKAIDKASQLTVEECKPNEFMVEPSHTKENPRLIRLVSPTSWDEEYRLFTTTGPIADVAADLLGPDVRFHHSKLNFKWHSGGEEVGLHQDVQFWPHTNYSPLTIGVYLEDVDEVMGPLVVIDKSHLGPLYTERSPETGAWTGMLSDEDLKEVDVAKHTKYLPGKAGSITIHNCRMIHGSEPNVHPTKARPLLLQAYAAGNALVLGEKLSSMQKPKPGDKNVLRAGDLICGEEPSSILFDPRPCPWSPIRTGGSFFKSVAKGEIKGQAGPTDAKL